MLVIILLLFMVIALMILSYSEQSKELKYMKENCEYWHNKYTQLLHERNKAPVHNRR